MGAAKKRNVWEGGAVNNPANVIHRDWRTTNLKIQLSHVRDLLRGTRQLHAVEAPLILPGGRPVLLQRIELISTVRTQNVQVRHFHAWAPPAEDAPGTPLTERIGYAPSEHWRLLYLIDVHDDGKIAVTAVEVAPDDAKFLRRPRPILPA